MIIDTASTGWKKMIKNVDGSSYTTEFRQYDPRIGRWLSLDPLTAEFPAYSPYIAYNDNPIANKDIGGDSVWVYATTLPGADSYDMIGGEVFTHTFIVVKRDDGTMHYFVYGPKPDQNGDWNNFGGSSLARLGYKQDKKIIAGDPDQIDPETGNLKAKILVDVPEGMTSSDFDREVINAGKSFGNNPGIEYDATTNSSTTGNCNTSTTTILSKAGVGEEQMDLIEWQVPGLDLGFGVVRPWTNAEQAAALAKGSGTPPPPLGTQL